MGEVRAPLATSDGFSLEGWGFGLEFKIRVKKAPKIVELTRVGVFIVTPLVATGGWSHPNQQDQCAYARSCAVTMESGISPRTPPLPLKKVPAGSLKRSTPNQSSFLF